MLSVIVSTYNRPRELGLVLAGLRRQTCPPFEVIVADDGSTRETKESVERIRKDFPHPLLHVWQEDQGFRLAAIRNRAIEAASGESIVFLDGDCIPFPGFLETHDRDREHGTYLSGQRLRLDEEHSAEIADTDLDGGSLAHLAPMGERAREMVERLRAEFYRATGRADRPKLIGCNASMTREDVLGINGFDENFVGWGGEDDDLSRRLRRRGLRPKSVIGRARVLHLHHPPDPSFRGRVRDGGNHQYLHRGFFLSRCRNGISSRSIGEISIHFLHAPESLRAEEIEPPCEVDVLFAPSLGESGFHDEAEIRVLAIRGPTPKPRLVDACHIGLIVDGVDAPAVEARLKTQGKWCRRLPPARDAALADAIIAVLDDLI